MRSHGRDNERITNVEWYVHSPDVSALLLRIDKYPQQPGRALPRPSGGTRYGVRDMAATVATGSCQCGMGRAVVGRMHRFGDTARGSDGHNAGILPCSITSITSGAR